MTVSFADDVAVIVRIIGKSSVPCTINLDYVLQFVMEPAVSSEKEKIEHETKRGVDVCTVGQRYK